MGGTETRIGLLDVHQNILISETIPTRAERPASEVIREIARRVRGLLENQGISMDQCVGIGIGVPGTVDRSRGIVRYSNNIHWENVELAKEMGSYLPIPVRIANDADCAALGETVARTGNGYEDVVMITLGAGVGGSIILDGELYDGKRIGGSEIGHMVIVENGEPCTCGRRGCLEAYVSVPALMREIRRAAGQELTLAEIRAAADDGDMAVQGVLEQYENRLGAGIVNIVNIFRPQLILLGGTLAVPAERLLQFLRETVKSQCFGGNQGQLPEIEAAVLGKDAAMIGAAALATLLQDCRIKVYEVAEKAGYRDITYFSSVFKKLVGVNPSEFQDRSLLK
ncbi:MAG: ROK family protein [Lachnospiraceae bacterium]|nr:ROK family protein [Lachnospiraceae bacterium]